MQSHPLKGFFALGLALPQVFQAVVLVAIALKVHILLWAPLIVVHAIHDAAELPAAVPEDVVQAPSALLCLALPCIPEGIPGIR